VLEPVWLGAIIGVGPLFGVELELDVVRVGLEKELELEVDALGAGGLEDETVRTARTAVPEPDERCATGWDRRVERCTTFALAVAAWLAGFRTCDRALLACEPLVDGLLATAAESAPCATGAGAPRGSPCTIATAAPTPNAPPSAPIIAHESERRRRPNEGASHWRARRKPSSAAQKATPPYLLAAT
jgi:hypothetical protein